MIFRNSIKSIKSFSKSMEEEGWGNTTIILTCILLFFINFIIDCVLLYVGYHVGKYIINLF